MWVGVLTICVICTYQVTQTRTKYGTVHLKKNAKIHKDIFATNINICH